MLICLYAYDYVNQRDRAEYGQWSVQKNWLVWSSGHFSTCLTSSLPLCLC